MAEAFDEERVAFTVDPDMDQLLTDSDMDPTDAELLNEGELIEDDSIAQEVDENEDPWTGIIKEE